MSGRWLDVGEAARELGISTEAVRKRIQRGKLHAERHQDRMQVWLDEVRTESGPEAQVDASGLVEELRAHNATLREQLEAEREANRENRRIIAALTSRIPELEAPQERSPDASRGGSEGAPREEAPLAQEGAQEGAERASWWRRVFGG